AQKAAHQVRLALHHVAVAPFTRDEVFLRSIFLLAQDRDEIKRGGPEEQELLESKRNVIGRAAGERAAAAERRLHGNDGDERHCTRRPEDAEAKRRPEEERYRCVILEIRDTVAARRDAKRSVA